MNLSKDVWFGATGPATVHRRDQRMASRLRSGLHSVVARWIARRRTGRDAAVLLGFSDRELRDLGLSRCDLPGIIDGTWRRD